jgi:hypothetical protein
VAARARIHRCHQLEARRIGRVPGSARDGNASRFERLAQRFERIARELGQFVEEQHAVVRKRDFARARRHAAADQRRGRSAVMRSAIGPGGPARGIEPDAGSREHRCAFQRLRLAHLRQNPRQAGSEHRLAGSWRPEHQQSMRARGGDLERTLGARLALDVAKVRVRRRN